MTDWLLSQEGALRLGVFFGMLAIIALWEAAVPRRTPLTTRTRRWPGNLGIAALNTLLLRFLFPAAAVGMAFYAERAGWGWLNAAPIHPALAIVISLLALDLAIYLQHVLFHSVPALWRLHRVHHADLDFDVTTGVRFHPIEILISMGFKFVVIAALGAPAVAVLIFELLLSGTSLFNHANAGLPPRLERVTRWLVVTPDMHRVHHSVESDEQNANFGFCLPWWDRVFGTYRAAPRLGHSEMNIGVRELRDAARASGLLPMLGMPFKDLRKSRATPATRRSSPDLA